MMPTSALPPSGDAAEARAHALDRLLAAAGSDARIRALWLEAPSRAELRRPFRRLEVHLATDEPDFDAVLAGLEAILAGPSRLESVRRSDVPRFARQIDAVVDGASIAVVVERTSLIPKRPRAAVATLLDRTGHLPHVMDFSLPVK